MDESAPPSGEEIDKFNILLQHISRDGDSQRYQWRIFFLTSFCGIFFAFSNLSAAFIAAEPDFWCEVPRNSPISGASRTNFSILLESFKAVKNYSIYRCYYYDIEYQIYSSQFKINLKSNQRLIKNINYNLKTINDGTFVDKSEEIQVKIITNLIAMLKPFVDIKKTKCTSWIYDDSVYKSTVITEWDLVCDNKWMKSATQSTFMAGTLVGSILWSELSDLYGRRTSSVISSIGFFISGVTIAFSPNYWCFILLRFIWAFFGIGMFLPNFVLLMEMVKPTTRTFMGVMYQAFFSVGFCLLPLIAFLIRRWRPLQLALSVPSIILITYYWFLPESPRWLFIQGRYKEAIKLLKRMSKVNKTKFPKRKKIKKLLSLSNYKENKVENKNLFRMIFIFFKSLAVLVRTPIMRKRTLILWLCWFVVAMVYFGLTFSGENINASIYLMIFMGGIVEIPSYIFSCWTLSKYGRRENFCLSYLITGGACLLILSVPRELIWLNLTLASIGKFFSSISFAIAYIYSAELMPTEVRNVALGATSLFATIGSASAPFILDLLGEVHYTIPSTLFGVLSIISGLLALLLPQTGKSQLPQYIYEVEAMER